MNHEKLFISYTLRDHTVTSEHLLQLKKQLPLSYNTFIDILDNDSEDKQQRINQEIETCNRLILIDSPLVMKSKWVQYELQTAHFLGKPTTIIKPQDIILNANLPNMKHRVFISYHHANDQWAKDRLIELNKQYDIFIDESVDTGDIPDEWDDQKIRREIRDNYLKQSTVTILLVGTETKYRKHIDWEIYSSMINGMINRKSGIVVIMLPSTNCKHCQAMHNGEKTDVFPQIANWTNVDTRTEFERRFPYMPDRIIDNLNKGAKISVANWNDLNIAQLVTLIDNAEKDRFSFDYDMTREMRRINGWHS